MRSTQTVTGSRIVCVVYWKSSGILTLFWTKNLTAAPLQILLLIYDTVERDVTLTLAALNVSWWIWVLSIPLVFCNVVSVVLKRWRLLHFSVYRDATDFPKEPRSISRRQKVRWSKFCTEDPIIELHYLALSAWCVWTGRHW